jgi:GH25 family lysozyme M1 (1,4-beta-N-acetylmuramidase)
MIKGVDLSHWEQGFDFVKGVKDGIVFMMTKASEGTGVDVTCGPLCRKAKAAGIKYTGIYHFFHSNVPIGSQIATYMKQFKNTPNEMGPILDLEETSTNGHSFQQVAELALEWLEQAEAQTSKVPLLYIDMNMLNLTGIGRDPRFQKYPRWIARYSSHAPTYNWEFWQFTDKGEEGADTDWFNGSEDDLQKFLGLLVDGRG